MKYSDKYSGICEGLVYIASLCSDKESIDNVQRCFNTLMCEDDIHIKALEDDFETTCKAFDAIASAMGNAYSRIEAGKLIAKSLAGA